MGWWGKLAGGAFGFMLGGPLGALIGAAVGHGFDRGMAGLPGGDRPAPGDRERVQTAFFTTTFSVMGAIAKADGRVSEEEIALARAVMSEMDLGPDMKRAAINLFQQGKQAGFPLDEVLEQFRRECHRRQTLVQIFLEIQLQAAYADGRLDSAEERLLLHICGRLGFPREVFLRLEDMVRAESKYTPGARAPHAPRLSDAYAILNISSDVSDAELKKAYRRLMNQHHPDKLVSKGLPEEMIKLATQKTHEIRQAYEQIRKARGL